jgi:hypothetical protein
MRGADALWEGGVVVVKYLRCTYFEEVCWMHSKLPWGPSVSAVLERLNLKPAWPLLDSEDGNDRRWNGNIQFLLNPLKTWHSFKLYIMDDLKEKRVCWKFKEVALYGTLWTCSKTDHEISACIAAKAPNSFSTSVCPPVSATLPLDGFLIKVCQEAPKFG